MSDIVESTLGRFIFNEIVPQDLGFVDRSIEGNELLLEVDFHVGKKQLKMCIRDRFRTVEHGWNMRRIPTIFSMFAGTAPEKFRLLS